MTEPPRAEPQDRPHATTGPTDEPDTRGDERAVHPAGAERRGAPEPQRRSFVVAGAVILGIIAVLGVLATFVDKGPRRDTGVVVQQDSAVPAPAQPHIIPLPGEGGHKPTDAGDRGGWLQFVLAGTLFAAVLGGAGFLWWSSRRRRRQPGRSLSRRPRTNG